MGDRSGFRGASSSSGDRRLPAAAGLAVGGSPPTECKREAAARKARLAEVWDRAPVGNNGGQDLLAPWDGKVPFWACMLHQAVIEVKRGIAEEEYAFLVNSIPLIRNAVSPSVLLRITSLRSAHGILDRRFVNLTKAIKAIPEKRRREVARNLCERLCSARSSFSQGQGAIRLGRFMEVLNRLGEDVNPQGVYDDGEA